MKTAMIHYRDKHFAFLSIVAIFLLITALLLYALKPKRGQDIVAEGIAIKEITGTAEERLAKHADFSNAIITKIGNVSELQQKYSAIFKDAQEGMYVVETPDAILLYDPKHDEIVRRFEFRRITIGQP